MTARRDEVQDMGVRVCLCAPQCISDVATDVDREQEDGASVRTLSEGVFDSTRVVFGYL